MSTSLLRVVERAQQDAEQGPEAIQSNGLRRVSAPPTPTGRGPARSAHETLGRTLQLLRSERQPSKSGPSGSRHATGLAQMAAPSQPAHASHVGAVQPIVGTLPASPAAGCGADMGGVATRHISGGAGWWKSPCPVLVRASGEQSPGATRLTKYGSTNRSCARCVTLPRWTFNALPSSTEMTLIATVAPVNRRTSHRELCGLERCESSICSNWCLRSRSRRNTRLSNDCNSEVDSRRHSTSGPEIRTAP